MSIKLISVLLFGGLFIFGNSLYGEVLIQDAFVYKVNDEIFTISDIDRQAVELKTLACLYPDSLLKKIFPSLNELSKNKTRNSNSLSSLFGGELTDKLVEQYKEVFESSITLSKLNQYVESHNVYLSKNIIKAFYVATRKECKEIKIFKNANHFTDSFKDLLSSEVFLRRRFLGENERNISKKGYQKAILSIKGLLKTIDKQVSSKAYWK